MIRKQIDFHSEEINEIRTLYQQAFPKNEQTDLIWLFDRPYFPFFKIDIL